tara:strand:- start:354 stop:1082 length:729 start_codon:yes stop_codon:yes gene_type:complete
MSTKVSQYMGGLGIDIRDVLGADANGTVTIGDGFSTGNLYVGQDTVLEGGVTANGQAIFGNTASGANRVRIVTYAPDNSVYNQIGDGTFNTGGSYHFARYLSADNIAVTMNTITYSVDVTGNLSIGTNASNTLIVTGNADISDNLFVAKTVAIGGNTNPAATDVVVAEGNIRITSGSLIFPDGSTQSSGSGVATFPTGDFGLLDSANASTDAFGQVTAGLTTFDMLVSPTGSIGTEDLGALT